ncbi:hypothetical protein V6N11_042383 [Hibiscus sabdariffa]|uniref:DUF2921 domain-containing protein n=1 Tax=Hibiscus sabdariffa TaxID=183260 RepID=A0ABR2QW62_9ROSI
MKLSLFLWLCTLKISFPLISFLVKPVSSVVESYSDHCLSVVAESVPNSEPPGYEDITRHTNSFSVYTTKLNRTDKDGVFMIEGSFELHSPFYIRSLLHGTSKDPAVMPQEPPAIAEFDNPFVSKLHGFWSESSGKLCMVGTGSAYLNEGTLLTPAAVLKLYNIENSSSITSLITGTLESLES